MANKPDAIQPNPPDPGNGLPRRLTGWHGSGAGELDAGGIDQQVERRIRDGDPIDFAPEQAIQAVANVDLSDGQGIQVVIALQAQAAEFELAESQPADIHGLDPEAGQGWLGQQGAPKKTGAGGLGQQEQKAEANAQGGQEAKEATAGLMLHGRSMPVWPTQGNLKTKLYRK